MAAKKFKFRTEDYISYILSKLEPSRSNRIKLMKVAFFVEFAYKAKFGKDLSESKYAAIDLGPVIDDYRDVLVKMEKRGLIKLQDCYVLLTVPSEIDLPQEISSFIDPLIDKYSKFSDTELIALSHQTDSYKITTNNERKMGGIIDKDLAALETFFEDDPCSDTEPSLEPVDMSKLKKYEL